ncbi:hypothetical protein ACTGJ9_011850 [Bradyrhizobium sp. RDM12]
MPNGRCWMHGGPSPGHRRATGTRSSTAATRRKQLLGAGRYLPSFELLMAF